MFLLLSLSFHTIDSLNFDALNNFYIYTYTYFPECLSLHSSSHSCGIVFLVCPSNMNDPKYGYPYPPPGAYQGPPPVMAPPQYYAPPPPPRKEVGFLEGCLAALCCCCLLDECCCDPSVLFIT